MNSRKRHRERNESRQCQSVFRFDSPALFHVLESYVKVCWLQARRSFAALARSRRARKNWWRGRMRFLVVRSLCDSSFFADFRKNFTFKCVWIIEVVVENRKWKMEKPISLLNYINFRFAIYFQIDRFRVAHSPKQYCFHKVHLASMRQNSTLFIEANQRARSVICLSPHIVRNECNRNRFTCDRKRLIDGNFIRCT